jgi:uncharacterized protein YutE (UPF0331/DUF86 family)
MSSACGTCLTLRKSHGIKATAMRNRLTHGYFDWDLEVIWSTLTTSLAEL